MPASAQAPELDDGRAPTVMGRRSSPASASGRRRPARGRTGRAGAAMICSMIEMACGPSGHQAGPQQVAGDEPADAGRRAPRRAEHLLPVGQQLAQLGVEAGEHGPRRRRARPNGRWRHVTPELVVVVQVVRATGSSRSTQAKPCSRIQMISSWRRTRRWFGAVAARPLAHGELVLDDPGKLRGWMPWAHLPFTATAAPLACHR